jgi:hypothetical protein
MIQCPACECGHLFDDRWTFDGNMDRPTFRASMLVGGKRYPSGGQWPTDEEHARMVNGETMQMSPYICHSFVTDGRIQFLDDCTHPMKGQTVELEDW